MAMWRYIKGSEKDFEGAPDTATVKIKHKYGIVFADSLKENSKCTNVLTNEYTSRIIYPHMWQIIAQRERVTSINDDRLAQDVAAVKTLEMNGYTYHGGALWKPPLGKAPECIIDDNVNPKYNRPCKGVTIDVYDVLQAFNVTNPALQHLVKKALAVGQRGHKDKMEDLRDILASAQRAIELEESGK